MSEEEAAPENKTPPPKRDSAEISLDNLDLMINEEAPEFKESMEAISKEGEGVDYSEIDIESEVDSGQEEVVKKKTLKDRFPGAFKFFIFLKPLGIIFGFFKAKVSYYFTFIKNRVFKIFYDLFLFFKNDVPAIIKSILGKIIGFFLTIKNFIFKFKEITWAQRAQVIFFIGLACGSVYLMKQTFSGGWLGINKSSLVLSFNEVADKVYEFSKEEGIESFYSSFPQQEHNLLLKAIKVDLRRHNKFETPMGAFEMYINLDSKETAVEVKDREKEFLDLSQRVFEDYYYKEIQSIAGKEKVKENLKREMNLILNQGRVKNIYFKLFITKP